MLNQLSKYFEKSTLLIGLSIIIMNLGGGYIRKEVPDYIEEFFNTPILRRFFIFVVVLTKLIFCVFVSKSVIDNTPLLTHDKLPLPSVDKTNPPVPIVGVVKLLKPKPSPDFTFNSVSISVVNNLIVPSICVFPAVVLASFIFCVLLNNVGSVGDINVKSSKLNGIKIPSNYIASAIDEFPIIFIAASLAEGKTILRNAEELRHKESDRLYVMSEGLKKCKIENKLYDDGIDITGGKISGAVIDSFSDHRIAMSFAIAGLVSKGTMTIMNTENVST